MRGVFAFAYRADSQLNLRLMCPRALVCRFWTSAVLCLAARMVGASEAMLDTGLAPECVVERVAALPEVTPRAILQTRDGYLWIGTYKGLSRFDGVRSITFDVANTPALSIDAGDDSLTAILSTDQRGVPRLAGAHVDIGAFEVQPFVAVDYRPLLITSAAQVNPDNRTLIFRFAGVPDLDFIVVSSTNLSLPVEQWSIAGPAVQTLPGQYQFTDAAANSPQRFYSVHFIGEDNPSTVWPEVLSCQTL